jgi:hypothetical protein
MRNKIDNDIQYLRWEYREWHDKHWTHIATQAMTEHDQRSIPGGKGEKH